MAAPLRRPRAAVNVDVDGLYLYDRIHGHAGASGNAAAFDAAAHDPVVWARAVPRFLDLFARTGVPATFFVVAQDLAHPEVAAAFRDVVRAGHEIGSHSLTHPYDLSRQAPDAIAHELVTARKRLQDASGQAVVGFRAPGYVVSTALAEAIVDAGHGYDSSRFPCPPYQLAKAAFILGYRLLGRPSGSVAEPPAVWLGPRKPHIERLPSGRTLLELPIGVLPGLRWPFIGTAVLAQGLAGHLALWPLARGADWLNFECHGLDLADFERDGLPTRLRTEPALRVRLGRKWPVFVRLLEDLARSHDVRTLGQWAETQPWEPFEA
ncbi:MAG: polysaccharide deacetylase [Myxococcales bacterium]|nr:polysaccharide deacetylase [Myxococcales bacterium]